jgi:hypothetical protein
MKRLLPVFLIVALFGTAAYSIIRNGAAVCLIAGSCHIEGGIADKLVNPRDEVGDKSLRP